MLESFQPSSMIAATAVFVSLAILGYFLWKTFITSNFFQKGLNLYQQKDYSGAEAAFRKVISLNSTNDVVRLLLGDILMQQGKVEEAVQLFQYVINCSPKNADAYLRLGNALIQQEKQEDAITNLRKAKDLLQKQRQTQKAEKIAQFLDKISAKSS
ncbi:MAG: tetratricopeptide repeat protein [Heteroscytonema crispum UTEX LB 1556]